MDSFNVCISMWKIAVVIKLLTLALRSSTFHYFCLPKLSLLHVFRDKKYNRVISGTKNLHRSLYEYLQSFIASCDVPYASYQIHYHFLSKTKNFAFHIRILFIKVVSYSISQLHYMLFCREKQKCTQSSGWFCNEFQY